MAKYKSSSISDKWKKTNWLLEQADLRKHVPHTETFNRKNLFSMLSKYSTVYFKPTHGSGGAGIIRINKKNSGYQTQFKKEKSFFATADELYHMLSRFSNKRPYLLQKGIQLAKTNGKLFDIRVMVQKTKKGEWISTAVFAKIGSPGKIATNYNQGGSLGLFQPTLTGAGFHSASIQNTEEALKQLGVSVAKNFDRHLKGFQELGLDVAVDNKEKLWILEVNTRPQIYPLKYLKDKKLYHRTLSYAKQYGRLK